MRRGEWLSYGLEFGNIAFERLEIQTPLFEHAFDDIEDEVFGELGDVFDMSESDFGLDHPKFDEMAARFGFLGPEGGAEAVDLAESGRRRLVIELSALAQIGFLIEVLRFEKRRRAFAGAGREDRRIHEPEAAIIEKVPDSPDDFGSNLENGMLFL